MNKNILLVVLMFTYWSGAFAQTNATDFTVNDCGGISRHLFAELDAGKVIVMAMVHPCGSCVNPAKSALTTVNTFSGTHPGRVIYYLTDDDGGTPCTTLSSWGSTYGISGVVTISNPAVNQSSYGNSAMPKIVVVGGADHKVYFVQDNGLNTTNLTNAINLALAANGVEEKFQEIQVKLFPNPVVNKASVYFTLTQNTDITLDIYSILGTQVKSETYPKLSPGKQEIAIDLESLNNGIYFLKLNVNGQSGLIRFSISK